MRDKAATIAKRFTGAAAAVAESAMKGIDRLFEDVLPAPQPVPIPVRARRHPQSGRR